MKDYVQYGSFKMDYETVSINHPSPLRTLKCCCCGNKCKGRQWWNRDTGYGLCSNCAVRISKTEDAEYMTECYGHEGKHYYKEENHE